MSTQRANKKVRNFTVLADFGAIIFSYVVAYLFRFYANIVPMRGDAPSYIEYARALFIILPVYLWIFRAYGLYDYHRRIRRIEEIFQVIKAVSFATLVLMAITFLYRGFSYSRVYLAVSWIFASVIISLTRYYLIQIEYYRKRRSKELTKILILGADRNARQIIKWARSNLHYGQVVIGVLSKDPALAGKHVEDVPVLGIIDDYNSIIDQVKPDQVVLVDTSFPRDKITEIVVSCEDKLIEFKVVADVYGLLTRHVNVEYVSSVPLLGFKELPLDDPWNRFIKRSFDIITSLICLGIATPLFIIVWVLIKLEDRGPLFYKQERVGRDYRLFNLLKFRTMKVDAEKETGPVWASKDDDRRTKYGAFLRKSNLDEIPQLLNVLKGEMSMVGPRPERPHFVDKFREAIPRYMARHKIKSGLTGWAAVNGFRGNTSIQERVKYDLYYSENWSLLFDIEILFMTFSSKSFRNAY